MRAPPRPKPPKPKLFEELPIESLREQYKKNEALLMSSYVPFPNTTLNLLCNVGCMDGRPYNRQPSSSATVERLENEQAKIQARIAELQDTHTISVGIKNLVIDGEGKTVVDRPPPGYFTSRIATKKKALAAWVSILTVFVIYSFLTYNFQGTNVKNVKKSKIGLVSMEESIELERRAFLAEKERMAIRAARKERMAMPTPVTETGKRLTPKEYEAKVWAFMSYKPTDSDLEGEQEDAEDNDPASWLVDDQDDGIKGQDIVYPDAEEWADLIRVDTNIRYCDEEEEEGYDGYDGYDGHDGHDDYDGYDGYEGDTGYGDGR